MKSLSFVLVALVACAGTQEETIKPDPGGAVPTAPAKRMASGDVSFELPVIEIKGVLYEPDAVEHPGTPTYDPPKPKKPIPDDKIGTKEWKDEVAKHRALIKTKDPLVKQAEAALLTTMLYRESRKPGTSKDAEIALLTDARQVLRDIVQQVGDKAVDEDTVRMLCSYELLLKDYPSAEKAWALLIEKDPKSKELPDRRAWLAFSQLKQLKNAEALAAIGTYTPDEKAPELAYVMAWAKWRGNDAPGAWQAISAAAKGWGQNVKRDELAQNVLMFAGRANVPLDQVIPLLATLAKDKAALAKTKYEPLLYELLAKLGVSGYGLVGRWADGIAALDKAATLPGAAVPPNDLLVIRYSQADFTVRLDTPDVAAAFAKQAIDAIAPCGAQCTEKDKADMVQGIYLMGRLFHILYATANDKRYYQPAHDLYTLTIPLLPGATKTQAQKDTITLETTLKNTKVGTGTHEKGAIGALLARHTPEVQTCYEAVLAANPKVGGTLTLMLESDATGAIKGAASEPKAGLADLPAVAGCVIEHAKTWGLPKRGMAGSTRIKVTYTLAAKK